MPDKQTPYLDFLFKQVRSTFFSSLPRSTQEELPDMLSDVMGQAIDTHLDGENYRLLLILCLEDTRYFTEELVSPLCVRDHLTAAHVVYHLLYDELRAYLEVEWSEYVERKSQEKEESNAG